MSDPRELGLPPAGAPPAFVATPGALDGARRRHGRRTLHRRLAVGGGGIVLALAAIGLSSVLGNGASFVLEQDQPARHGDPAVTIETTPSPSAASTAAAAPGPGQVHTPTATPGAAVPRPAASPGMPAAATAAHDSSPLRRTEVAFRIKGGATCTGYTDPWTSTGWCFQAGYRKTLQPLQQTTMQLEMCNETSGGKQARFETAQQVTWSVFRDDYDLVWSSAERPSSFAPSETVLVGGGRCLRWQVDWLVTNHGRPLAPGQYTLLWTTSSTARNLFAQPYTGSATITVR